MSSDWCKFFRAKNLYTGPEFAWSGLAKIFWGKFEYVAGGEKITAGVPLTHFTADIEGGADFGAIAQKLTTMSREDIVAAGGFWVYLRANQGIIIPPASLIMNMNRGAMNIPDGAEDDEIAQASCDYLVPSQIDISVN